MKKYVIFLCFLFLLFLPHQSQADKLAPGPLKVEDLGKLVETATLEKRLIYQCPQTNEHHLLLDYVLRECWQHPFQVLDINLSNGKTRLIDGVYGRPGPNGTILHSNGKIYFGSGDPGYFMSYDPQTGKTQNLAKLADKGAQYLIEGDDGAIYLGESVKGYVERYDPKTGAWKNYGIIDDPGPPYYRYAYTLGADERYIYIGIGQMPWYLVIYDRLTGTQTSYWKNQQLLYCGVSKGLDGSWYAYASFPNVGGRWYALKGSAPPVLQTHAPAIDPGRGPLPDLQNGIPPNFPYAINLKNAYPHTGNGGRIKVQWQAKDTPTLRQAVAKLRIGPIPVKRLYAENNRFFGFTAFYGPVFFYNPGVNQVSILGMPQRSLYDALHWYGRYFLAGYPAAFMEYLPDNGWNLDGSSTNLNNPAMNPSLLSLPAAGSAKYHYYLAKGADGYVYVGEHHERDSVGGSLAWYHPVTGVTGGLREPFRQHDVRDLLAVGKQIIFSSNGINNNVKGRLFFFDVESKKVVKSLVPLPGEQNAGKLVKLNAHAILGVAKGASVDRVYRVDLSSGKLVYTRKLPGKAFGGVLSYDQRLIKGPDGYIWLYLDNTICRLNPVNGKITKIIEASPAGNLVFLKNDLYIYGQDTLRRIPGLLVP